MTRRCHMKFAVSHQDQNSQARRGCLDFPRGQVQTPAFMPVGTYGTVKGMLPRDIEEIGADIILGIPGLRAAANITQGDRDFIIQITYRITNF